MKEQQKSQCVALVQHTTSYTEMIVAIELCTKQGTAADDIETGDRETSTSTEE